jgi:hypothetical protein
MIEEIDSEKRFPAASGAGRHPPLGWLQFKDAAPLIAGVVDNGVCPMIPGSCSPE